MKGPKAPKPQPVKPAEPTPEEIAAKKARDAAKAKADKDAAEAAGTTKRLDEQRRRRGGGLNAFTNTGLKGVNPNQLSTLLGV